METFDQSKLVQTCSDAASSNLKLSITNEQHDKGDHLFLIDIGTFSLHTINRSFKN